MVCGCRKKKLPKVTKKEKENPVAPTQRRLVYVHIWNIQHKANCNFLTNPLDKEGIKWDWKLDKPPLNRGYPYLTVGEAIICIRRTIEAFKKNEL